MNLFTKFCKNFAISYSIITLVFIPLTLFGHNSEYTGFMDKFFQTWRIGEVYSFVQSWTVFAGIYIAFLLSSVIAILVIALSKKDDEAKPSQKISFWMILFFTCVFFVIVSWVMVFFSKGTGVSFENICGYSMVAVLFVTFASAFVGGLSYGIIYLWKRDKIAPAIVLGIVVLIFLPTCFISYKLIEFTPYSLVEAYSYLQNDYEYSSETPAYVAEEASSVEDGYVEFEKIEIPNPYFASLWDDPSKDRYIINEAISSTFYGNTESEYSSFYDIISGYKYNSSPSFQKAQKYLKSHPKELYQIFDSYKELLFYIISPDQYHNSGYAKLCNWLLTVHPLLYQSKSSKEVDETLDAIYNIMNNPNNGSFTSEYFEPLKPYIHTSVLEKFTDDGSLDKESVVWAYSFWARRHHEKNDVVVCRILNTIRNHYRN